jgi:hypothetical protein
MSKWDQATGALEKIWGTLGRTAMGSATEDNHLPWVLKEEAAALLVQQVALLGQATQQYRA